MSNGYGKTKHVCKVVATQSTPQVQDHVELSLVQW